jgi:DNA-binding MarR family transcriptional regulator
VLAYLSREDGMTQTQLAEELDLGKVAVGGLIDRLEKTSFVRREPDPADRRVNRIYLEPKSRSMIAQLRKVEHRLNRTILNSLDEAQLEVTATSLAVMKRNLIAFLGSGES